MKIDTTELSPSNIEADAVVVGVYQDSPLGNAAQDIDAATEGVISRLVKSGEINGKALQIDPILAPQGVQASQVVVMGLGPRDNFDCGTAYRATAAAARQLAKRSREIVAFCGDSDWPSGVTEAAIAGACVGCQGTDLYRSEKDRHPFDRMIWTESATQVTSTGHILGEAVNLARRLVNEPPSELYPETFAEIAGQVATDAGLQIEIWDQAKLETENCGALLAVARGSANPPRLVIARHVRDEANSETLALVGKGVTFDSGGLSLKPSDGMKTMKCDMAGAATVLGAMQAIAKMNLPVNVIGLMGLVENMPSRDAYRLGDVLTARNGKTIEVLNTDAEGRLVLADTLCVAVDQGANRIIDLATLTGACMVALGMEVAGLMTNDQTWCDSVSTAAAKCGERAWQLPMFPEFAEQIKSEIADIKNVGSGRWGGAITAAKLLEAFVDGRPWVHIDIAGPAFLESSKPWQDAGGTGAFVRTLVETVRSLIG